MGDIGSKHDRVLNRVHLWIAVLGGTLTFIIGIYNFKNVFFPDKAQTKQAAESSIPQPQKIEAVSAPGVSSLETLLSSMDKNGDAKVSLSEWPGTREDLFRLDLDGNDAINAADLRARFSDMDTNGDNLITRLEWRKTRRAFDAIDLNNDGKINPDEFSDRQRSNGI